MPDTVPASELPGADQPRYPRPITLRTLEEPPAPLPRTADQEREDLEAARRVVELASAESTDSDRLDSYFPTIKERFRLSRLGYEGDFQGGFRVVGKINPEFSFEPDELLSGTGIPGDLQQGRITRVAFKAEKLGPDDVGVEMEALPLGPDHPQGSGPAGQNKLMDLLPTDPSKYRPADERYIRGHLLNDNLGGPGRPVNLFPITALANARHHSQIESQVKTWVNDRKLWTTYKVEITNRTPLQPAVDGLQSIDATVKATAAVLDTELNPVQTLSVSVQSHYRKGGEPEDVTLGGDAAATDALRARPEDDIPVQLSTTQTTRTFDRGIYADLAAALDATSSLEEVMDQLEKASGFGPGYARVLTKAWQQASAGGNPEAPLTLDSTEKAVLTRIVSGWATFRAQLATLSATSNSSS